ncbi:CsgG/HfaB family protein (plasmid) [Pseudoalteromonas lipolytica]|uniref:CsgG/HfaB family protein n=1 Tax=Pseudoalteromonas TaxID=53246 RepID=UPI0018F49CEC|nr:CsgG/HfaB family protein [Pseudoalteromonas sp. bablab_jr011]
MEKKCFLALILIGTFVISGCTSATRQVTNESINKNAPVVSATQIEEFKGLKRTVAIARFSDETKRGNSFLLDSNNNRIGKQASDILAARLTDSGKFIMIEHDAIASLQPNLTNQNQITFVHKKADGANKVGLEARSIGAEQLIIGSVSEFGRTTESEVGVFSRNKIQKATATVNIRLVDIKTGQILFSEEATGEARSESNRVLGVGETAAFDTSLDDKALSAAISKLTSNVMENLLDKPWQAYIVSEQGSNIIITGGKNQGFKLGDKLIVKKRGEIITNPQTGLPLELPRQEQAKIEIVGFLGSGSNSLSLCKVISGDVQLSDKENLVVEEVQL